MESVTTSCRVEINTTRSASHLCYMRDEDIVYSPDKYRETEGIKGKDLGIVMTQNTLDAYAMANGWGKTTQTMSEAEKVALRYQFVQSQLSAASGDFVRTSDSWANQIRVLKLQFDSLKASLGQGLINILTPALKLLNQLLAKVMTAAAAFKSFTEMLTGKKAQGGSGFKDTSSDLSAAAGAADSLTNSTEGVGKAAEKASRSLMGFDKINKLEDKSRTESGAGSTGNLPSKGMDINFGNLAEGDTVIDELDSKFQNMFQKIQRNIQPTIDSFKRLWNEGLQKLGSFTQTALGDFFSGFLGKVAGWLFQTGIPGFVDALNEGLMAIKFDDINEALSRLWDALAPFAINIGEGLLWFWQNVLVPLGVWTANEVVPRFLDTLAIAVEAVNNILEALKPLFQWFWDNVLKPLASWTGGIFLSVWDKINEALKVFSEWCNKNPGVIQGITVTVATFFAAWKGIELLSFIQQSGGIVSALGRISKSLFGATAAKVADKVETLYLNALYAKDFVMGIGASIKALAMQAKQFVINTAAKVADTVAQAAMTAATVAWNTVCTIATTLTKALSAAIAFMTSPIGLVVIAFTALIAVGVLVYKNWDTIKEKAIAIWGAIRNWFDSVTKKIGDFFSRLWSGIADTFKNIGSWFKQKFTSASDGIKNAFSGIGNYFSGIWSGIKNTFSLSLIHI